LRSQIKIIKKPTERSISGMLYLSKSDLKSLLKEKKPEAYKQLLKDKELDEWAEEKLASLNREFERLLNMNSEVNPDQIREILLEEYR
jgi:hypothetical protein